MADSTDTIINPKMLEWVEEMSALNKTETIASYFPDFEDWKSGKKRPSHSDLEKIADVANVPFGYLFLDNPFSPEVYIPDLRSGVRNYDLSPNLVNTVCILQHRQSFYAEYDISAIDYDFVGSSRVGELPAELAKKMRNIIGTNWRRNPSSVWETVLNLRESLEEAEIYAVFGYLANGKENQFLNADEFACIVSVENMASGKFPPAVFVNTNQPVNIMIFTLARALAHVFLGPAGAGILDAPESMLTSGQATSNKTARFCADAASHFLLSDTELQQALGEISMKRNGLDVSAEAQHNIVFHLEKELSLPACVTVRRLYDVGIIGIKEFRELRETLFDMSKTGTELMPTGFYEKRDLTVGKTFATRVGHSAGRIGYHEAYQLTGLYYSDFDRYVEHANAT